MPTKHPCLNEQSDDFCTIVALYGYGRMRGSRHALKVAYLIQFLTILKVVLCGDKFRA